ncbi:hypothetical protein [Nocardioides mangrovi]|uniref:PASTA domain-containing protein n=1 Tax=Nocardioides mangrovi TaxID=2874580 RepID=A0ABS7UBC3_9ACTN|nr:hypothetical protein [Nocardioides mangrovi]MBZ5738293.1 hypothetical protein [Nocardioides mangrovi]
METTSLNRWVFGLLIVVLAAAVLGGPLVLGRAMGLDARTPANAAYAALADEGLDPVSTDGKAMKPQDGPESVSQFSLSPGSTTENVRFIRAGTVVRCDVHVPDDPADTTADCG